MEAIQTSFNYQMQENPIGESKKDALRVNFRPQAIYYGYYRANAGLRLNKNGYYLFDLQL